MRIAITTPTTWPYVRRGAERFVNELAAWLGGRGHDVTVISAKPGARAVARMNGYRTVYHRRLWHPSFARIGLLEFHAFFLRCLPALVAERYDVVHAVTFLDTFAATLARRITGTPVVFWVNSLRPPVQYFRSLSTGGRIHRRAMRNADVVVAQSRYMQVKLEEEFGRPTVVLPAAVDLTRVPLSRTRDLERPIVLCVAALDDARKGGRLLMQAFNRVKRVRPAARLEICSQVSERTQAALMAEVDPEWRTDVRFLGPGRLEDLPAVYGRAAATVLPALWEPFGLSLIESLAAGTPIVGARDGVLPEHVTSDRVGRLFDPGEVVEAAATNAAGLADAILETLELSRRHDTPDHCRARAEEYGWETVGPAFEALYEDLVRKRGPRAAGAAIVRPQ